MMLSQKPTQVWRSRKPRSALGFQRHQNWNSRNRGARRARRGPRGARSAQPSRTKTVGRMPRHRENPGITLARPSGLEVRFIDLCCGLGGFTQAGIDAGWTPVASVDFCESVASWFGWNFSHPFERVDLTSPKARTRLTRKYEDIHVVLFSPPCQPYSVAGTQRPGDRRTRVVRAGIQAAGCAHLPGLALRKGY